MIERVSQSVSPSSYEPDLTRVFLDQAKFNLLPKELAEIKWTEDDEFRQIYDECYRVIFAPRFEPDSLYKRHGLREHVVADAAKLRCPTRLFILTVMWGHREKNPTSRFYCTMLGGDAAARRVLAYRAEVEAQYGTFTEKTLTEYSGDSKDFQSYERILLDSETVAGNWIVGYKMRRSGPVEKEFYQSNEFSLPDLWLAIEPSYYKLLLEWNKTRVGTAEQNKKRARVAKLTIELRRQSKRAISIFKMREAIMPLAIKKVAADKGFNVRQFRVSNQLQYTDTFQFWTRFGLAIQHLWCWEYLKGNRQMALRNLGVGMCTM
jgi:hypothetical protein